MQPPESYIEVVGPQPESMSILDAVVASAAFADPDETRYSPPLTRVPIGMILNALNISWSTEIRNYNVGDVYRTFAAFLPFPLYLFTTGDGATTPSIHLQDGGNAENSGIFSLLRRGYRKIIYAHGTEDGAADWLEICHIKNQLELDGTYTLNPVKIGNDGEDLNDLGYESKGKFKNYLDGLCSKQLDDSDLAVFDRDGDTSQNRVAKLYCDRLEQIPTAPKNSLNVCKEYEDRKKTDCSLLADTTAFYNWPASRHVAFEVRRKDATEKSEPLSTIYAVVPGISPDDVRAQVDTGLFPPLPKGKKKHSKECAAILDLPVDKEEPSNMWEPWCQKVDLDPAVVAMSRVKAIKNCMGPDGKPIAGEMNGNALPCIALARIIEENCTGGSVIETECKNPHAFDGKCAQYEEAHPKFPQNSFVTQTANGSSTSYAAYFDLARQQTVDLIKLLEKVEKR